VKLVNTINILSSERGDIVKSISSYLTSETPIPENTLLMLKLPSSLEFKQFHPEPPTFIKNVREEKIVGWKITPYLRFVRNTPLFSYGIRIDTEYELQRKIMEIKYIDLKSIGENIFKLNILLKSSILRKFRLIVGPLPQNYFGLKYEIIEKKGCKEKLCNVKGLGFTRVYIFESKGGFLEGSIKIKLEPGPRFFTILPLFLQGIISKKENFIKAKVSGAKLLVLNRVNFDLPDYYLSLAK